MSSLKKALSMVLTFVVIATYFCVPAFATVPKTELVVGASSTEGAASNPNEGIRSNLVITSYKVTNSSGSTLSKIKKGSTANLEVKVKNMGIKTSQIMGSGDIDISKLVDSFEGETTPTVTITSQGDDPLTMTIKFSGLRYEGPGKTFKFIAGYKSLNVEYDTKELTITECDEYNGSGNNNYDGNPAPILLVSRGDDKQMLKPNQEAEITILIKNVSSTDIYDVVVSLTPSDSVYLVEGRNSFFLKELPGKKSDTTKIKIRTSAEIASATQTIGVDIKYNYDNGSSIVQGSTSEKVTISAQATSGSGNPVPYIIVSNYTYGGESVAANSIFKLSMDFSNTSTTTNIENIVISMETGENFAIATSSNTFYYKNLGAGKKLTKEVELQALPGAKPGAQSVELNFKYEYSDGGKRSSNTMSEKLSIPIYLPDRFELAQPKIPAEGVAAGQEAILTVSYVNKGKVAVSNVEAIIEGDVESPAKIQNLGNIEAGKSGSIGFAFTPQQAGNLSFTIKISYEDANSKLITREFPIKTTVTEAMPAIDDMNIGGFEQPEKKSPLPLIIVVLLVIGIVIGVIFYKKKKAKQPTETTDLDFAWEDEDSSEYVDNNVPIEQPDELVEEKEETEV